MHACPLTEGLQNNHWATEQRTTIFHTGIVHYKLDNAFGNGQQLHNSSGVAANCIGCHDSSSLQLEPPSILAVADRVLHSQSPSSLRRKENDAVVRSCWLEALLPGAFLKEKPTSCILHEALYWPLHTFLPWYGGSPRLRQWKSAWHPHSACDRQG